MSRHRYAHSWRVGVRAAVELQRALAARLRVTRRLPLRRWRLVAGADAAPSAAGDEILGAVVVVRWPDLHPVERVVTSSPARFPYVPGLLSFREGPVLLRAFRRLRSEPDVLVFDAQGVAHPRGFGLATHLGLLLDCPSVGCAKSKLVGEHGAVGRARGCVAWLDHDGRRVGAVVRTRNGVRPVFVSVGYGIGLPSAVRLVVDTARYRLPEPTRQAHLLVRAARRGAVPVGLHEWEDEVGT